MNLLEKKYTKESPEVYYTTTPILSVTKEELKLFKEQAALNASKKIRLCCHRDTQAAVHEMLIILGKDVRFQPHKHLKKSESFHIIEGQLNIHLYDDHGALLQVIEMGDMQSGKTFYYRLDEAIFHTVIPQSEFVVFHEVTSGPFVKDQNTHAEWKERKSNLT